MQPKPKIDLSSWYSLVAIWQFSQKKWELIELMRPHEAIMICRHYKHPDSSWMVFPTKFGPVECQHCIHPASRNNQADQSQIDKLQKHLSIS